MNKLALSVAVSAILVSPAFAAYTGSAVSGTAAAPLSGIVVQAGSTTNVYYVDPTATANSVTNAASIQLTKASDWTFDFTNLAAVTFTGNIQYGTYKTQTNVTGLATIDGRQSYTGVTQAFSGTGSYNEATNTFTFTRAVGASTASLQTQTTGTCVNGKTSILGKVCTSFASATPNWEGLALSFVFSEDRSTFAGTLKGTDTSGSGLTQNTTTINWQISGTQPIVTPTVPVPAAAWLFGSGVIGLAGVARRRSKAA